MSTAEEIKLFIEGIGIGWWIFIALLLFASVLAVPGFSIIKEQLKIMREE